MKFPVLALASSALAHDVSDDWMDWECPGFPCFVVNYFDVNDKDDFRQACTPLTTMSPCRQLIKGENFPARLADGGIAGWHNSTKGHPCTASYGCDQAGGCLQGSRGKCYALCDQLNLIAPYEKRCTDTCQMYCPEETDEIACSQCEAHGYDADKCECGQCSSFGGCGWTCGKDPSRQPLGPKCIHLPPAPSPTPVVPPSPPPPPGPPPPNPDLPAGGCCSWAGEGEMDECGDSTSWCKANANNCKACDGHWACPDGPCPAPAPSPSVIPAGGCCSWAKAGQSDECGQSTSWCKSSVHNCQECQGHWVYPEADFDCSQCSSHGYGADQCGCGYCGSYGGCGWTCGHDSSKSPPGPKCSVGTFEV